MIPKKAAEAAADELLAHERAQEIAARNARARRVNPILWVPELQAIDPWERRQALSEALRYARGRLPFVLCVCGWVVLLVTYFSDPEILGDTSTRLPIRLLLYLPVIPSVLMLRSGVRKYLRDRRNG